MPIFFINISIGKWEEEVGCGLFSFSSLGCAGQGGGAWQLTGRHYLPLTDCKQQHFIQCRLQSVESRSNLCDSLYSDFILFQKCEIKCRPVLRQCLGLLWEWKLLRLNRRQLPADGVLGSFIETLFPYQCPQPSYYLNVSNSSVQNHDH